MLTLTTTIGGKFTWRPVEKIYYIKLKTHASKRPKLTPCSLMLKFGLCWNVVRGKHCSMVKKGGKFIVWHRASSLRLKLSLPEEGKRLHIHLGRNGHYRSLTITFPDLLQLVALGEFLQLLHRSQQSREWQEKLTTAITSLPMWTAPDDENDS